ncbi:hypothetical protein PROFUN_14876 [Planoprotostelium fungivorum]|uniref:Uncharacterized protein n=1 Tax=Planoprotostelium fungivorum TaxID=1890364 RepID=A0A2P6MSB8_9EUKA|nr:hypothetical protein PROFUN_14876 [Planoprotostelium fungivorum]
MKETHLAPCQCHLDIKRLELVQPRANALLDIVNSFDANANELDRQATATFTGGGISPVDHLLISRITTHLVTIRCTHSPSSMTSSEEAVAYTLLDSGLQSAGDSLKIEEIHHLDTTHQYKQIDTVQDQELRRNFVSRCGKRINNRPTQSSTLPFCQSLTLFLSIALASTYKLCQFFTRKDQQGCDNTEEMLSRDYANNTDLHNQTFSHGHQSDSPLTLQENKDLVETPATQRDEEIAIPSNSSSFDHTANALLDDINSFDTKANASDRRATPTSTGGGLSALNYLVEIMNNSQQPLTSPRLPNNKGPICSPTNIHPLDQIDEQSIPDSPTKS